MMSITATPSEIADAPKFSGPGAAYRALREAAGMSLEACSQATGVPADYLHKVEEGIAMPEPAWWTAVGHIIARQL